jgi:hypothetical protein
MRTVPGADQPVPLLGRDRDSGRQFATQDLVLDLQIGNLAGQLLVRGAGNQQQESVVDIPHGRCGRKMLSSRELISFWHTGMPLDSR